MIPQRLRSIPRWLRWNLVTPPDGGKPTRRPAGSTRNPKEWYPHANVATVATSNEHGVGFVFTGRVRVDDEEDGNVLLALDLDACVVDMPEGLDVAPWANAVIEACGGSYTERSPSGTGLRVFVLARDSDVPPSVPLVFMPGDPVNGKRPQLQVFGCGAAGYVTVTGDHLPDTTDEPLEVADVVARLVAAFPAAQWRPKNEQREPAPPGRGTPPEIDAIERAVRSSQHGPQLVAGEWEECGYESASEGWYSLAAAALSAARNHVEPAVEFLLTRTAYGAGDVDSRDPGRYRRESWVRADLLRLVEKRGDRAAAFDDTRDWSTWEPPAGLLTGTDGGDGPVSGGPPDGPRLRFLPVAVYAQQTAALSWLFRGLLPAIGLAQLYGDPSAGKTTVAVDLAVHVALGLDWAGHQCRRPGRVFYIAGEGGSGLTKRFRAALGHVAPLTDLEALDVQISDRAGAFTDEDDRKVWSNHIRKVQRDNPASEPALIVVDTQARNFGPGNENDVEDVSAFIAGLTELGREAGALVLVVHHTGHGDKERGRGSSAMLGALDASLQVTRDEGSRVITIRQRKAKDWEEAPPISRTMRSVQVGVDEDGEPVTAVVLSDEPIDADPFDVDTAAPEEAAVPDVDTERLVSELQKVVGNKAPVRVDPLAFTRAHGITRWQLRKLLAHSVAHGFLTKHGSTRDSRYLSTGKALNLHSERTPNSPTPNHTE